MRYLESEYFAGAAIQLKRHSLHHSLWRNVALALPETWSDAQLTPARLLEDKSPQRNSLHSKTSTNCGHVTVLFSLNDDLPTCYIGQIMNNVVLSREIREGAQVVSQSYLSKLLRGVQDFNCVKVEQERRKEPLHLSGLLDRCATPLGFLKLHLDVLKNQYSAYHLSNYFNTPFPLSLDKFFFTPIFTRYPWREVEGFFSDRYSHPILALVEAFYRHIPTRVKPRFLLDFLVSTPLCHGTLQRLTRTPLLQQYARSVREETWRSKKKKKHSRLKHTRPSSFTAYKLISNVPPAPLQRPVHSSRPIFNPSDIISPISSDTIKKTVNRFRFIKHNSSIFLDVYRRNQSRRQLRYYKTLNKSHHHKTSNQIHYHKTSSEILHHKTSSEIPHHKLYNQIPHHKTNNQRGQQQKGYYGQLVTFRPNRCEGNRITNAIDKMYEPPFEHLSEVERECEAWEILKYTRKLLVNVCKYRNTEYAKALEQLAFLQDCQIPLKLCETAHIIEEMRAGKYYMRVVLVVGLVGKTITATRIASGLASTGYRVGLFTYPHTLTIRERITVNGSFITKSEFVKLFFMISNLLSKRDITVSFQEWIILIAIAHFQRHDCHFVIFEVPTPRAPNEQYSLWELFVDSLNLACVVVTAVQPISVSKRVSFHRILRRLQSYLPPNLSSTCAMICGPSVTEMLQKILAQRSSGAPQTIELPDKTIFIRPGIQESFLEENTRIASATLAQLNTLFFSINLKTIREARPLFRFRVFDFRTQQLAARHIHYYLQYAYNMTRSLHLQWRLLAMSHPELFVYIFHNRKRGIRTLRAHCTKFNNFCVCESSRRLRTKSSTSSSMYFSQDTWTVYFYVARRHLFSLCFKCGLSCKETSPRISLCATPTWRDNRDAALQSLRRTKDWIATVTGAHPPWEPSNTSSLSRLWFCPNSTLFVRGARCFLLHCTDAVEEWPTNYSSRLPFENEISHFKRYSNTATKDTIESLERQRVDLLNLLKTLKEVKGTTLNTYSFQRFSAYNNESLYWSFREVTQLRERNSKSIRRPDVAYDVRVTRPMLNVSSDLQDLQHIKGIRIPAQAQQLIALVKAKVKQLDSLMSQLQKMHWVFPTPYQVVIDCPRNALSFEKCFLDFRKLYAGHPVRLCLVLNRKTSLTNINSVASILNHNGKDLTFAPCVIKGIHVFHAYHPEAKTMSDLLHELHYTDQLDSQVKSLILRTLCDEVHAQLAVAPPLSPIPLETLRFFVMQVAQKHQPPTSQQRNAIDANTYMRERLDFLLNTHQYACGDTTIYNKQKFRIMVNNVFSSDEEREVDQCNGRNKGVCCSGNLRVLRRMHHVCSVDNTNGIEHCTLCIRRRRFRLYSLGRGYMDVSPKKPLCVLRSSVSWMSLCSLICRPKGINEEFTNHCFESMNTFPYTKAIHSATCVRDEKDMSFHNLHHDSIKTFSNRTSNQQTSEELNVNLYSLTRPCPLTTSTLKQQAPDLMVRLEHMKGGTENTPGDECNLYCATESIEVDPKMATRIRRLVSASVDSGPRCCSREVSKRTNYNTTTHDSFQEEQTLDTLYDFRWRISVSHYLSGNRHRNDKSHATYCWAQFCRDPVKGQLSILIRYDEGSDKHGEKSQASRVCVPDVVIPVHRYCDIITQKVWYAAFKRIKRCRRSCPSKRHLVRCSAKLKCVSREAQANDTMCCWFHRWMLTRCKAYAHGRVTWSWSQVKQVVCDCVQKMYERLRSGDVPMASRASMWMPHTHIKTRDLKQQWTQGRNGTNNLRALLQTIRTLKDSKGKRLVTDTRLRHLLTVTRKKELVNIIQQGDMQLQLSVAFQKAAAEQSVLLICSDAVLAGEIADTFGLGSLVAKKDPGVAWTSYYSHNNIVTKDILSPSCPCWRSSSLEKTYFSKGYATLSPSALCCNMANAYLARAYAVRKQNELSTQADIARYIQEKEYLV